MGCIIQTARFLGFCIPGNKERSRQIYKSEESRRINRRRKHCFTASRFGFFEEHNVRIMELNAI